MATEISFLTYLILNFSFLIIIRKQSRRLQMLKLLIKLKKKEAQSATQNLNILNQKSNLAQPAITI